jgi:Family of unknown function (DUF5995)
MPAQNIDEVITQISDIIDRSRSESNRLGYFAALYRKVTINVLTTVVIIRLLLTPESYHYLANRRLRMIFSKAGL